MSRYALSWREKERRWRKRYRGKDYYFSLHEGETKASSYRRCKIEWERLKTEIDADQLEKDEASTSAAWTPIVTALREAQQQLINDYGDNEGTRLAWSHLEKQWGQRIIAAAIGNGRTPDDRCFKFVSSTFGREIHLTELAADVRQCRNLFCGESEGPIPSDAPATGEPPWERDDEAVSEIGQLAQKFCQHIESKTAPRRAKNIRRDIESWLATLPSESTIGTAFSGQSLSDYLHKVEVAKLADSTKRDKVAAVKQFAKWAYNREYLPSMPRMIAVKEFRVPVGESEIETFTDDEVSKILRAANERERLYILLALNCGFTQVDISDLLSSEVDLRKGVIVRKRSKTKGKKSVPEIRRKLWPETRKLLKANASKSDGRILLNAAGNPLVVQDRGRTDGIAKAMERLRKKMKRTHPISFSKFRATAASKLGEHGEYRAYAQYFLGHSPGTVADKHYVKPSQRQFDCAVAWLGDQWSEARSKRGIRTTGDGANSFTQTK